MNINDIQTPFFVLDRKVMVDEVQKLNYAIATYWPNTIPALLYDYHQKKL